MAEEQRRRNLWIFWGEIHKFGVCILNVLPTTWNTRFGRMWFGPQLISGLGIGRRKMEEKMSGMKETLGEKEVYFEVYFEEWQRFGNRRNVQLCT